jgi:hypothetical protein
MATKESHFPTRSAGIVKLMIEGEKAMSKAIERIKEDDFDVNYDIDTESANNGFIWSQNGDVWEVWNPEIDDVLFRVRRKKDKLTLDITEA